MKKILSASLAAALLGGGLVLATASSASAATVPDELCQPVYETVHHDAVGEPTIPNPAYVPEVPEISHIEIIVDSPEVPEISHTEYLYRQLITGKEKWLDSLTWNPGLGWYYTGQTRVVVDQAYQPAVTHEETVIDQAYQPAVGEPTIPNPEYQAAYDEQVQTGETCDIWVTWETEFLVDDPQNADDVAWPQTFIGFGQIAPACDQQVQQDRYVGDREAIQAILADDTLDGLPPEDSGVVTSWVFVDGGTCAPEPQEPQVIVTYGEFGGAEPSCETPEVTWTRERTTVTTPYIVVGDAHTGWSQVLDTEHATTITETDDETLVVEYDGDCTPAPAPEPETPAKAASASDELAHTGTDGGALLWWVAAAVTFMLAGGVFTVGAVRRR